jgi:hypothetical protein
MLLDAPFHYREGSAGPALKNVMYDTWVVNNSSTKQKTKISKSNWKFYHP